MSHRDELLALKSQRPFYDVSTTRRGRPGFVLWIDLLGTKAAMNDSMPRALNFVMKLHIVFLESRRAGDPHYFPMNDGAFLVHQHWARVSAMATKAFRRLAITFALEDNQVHRFMVRGGIAYGDCLFGSEMAGRNRRLTSEETRRYSSRIVLGKPLADAYTSEADAPPFGIKVHESAKSQGVPTTKDGLWAWYEEEEVEKCVKEELRSRLDDHLAAATYPKAAAHRMAAASMLR